MKEQTNGRIKLSWAQIVWGLAVITGILGSWADLRVQLARAFEKIEAQDQRIRAIEVRNSTVGFTQQDAERLRSDIVDELRRSEIRRRPR